MDSDFWRGRRVLITGHTGFKGAWLSLWLHQLGAVLTGYSLEPPTDPSLFDLVGLEDDMSSVGGDVRDLDRLVAAVREAEPEIVIHMAAQSLVRASYQDPVETFGTNVMGAVHVLEALRRVRGVRAALVVTSDKCYENREWLWPYRENERLGGHDPYSTSKAGAELVAASYQRSFFAGAEDAPRLATARAGNVIGGGDWAIDRLFPDIMRAILAGEPVVIRNPDAVRPWQHVLEPLTGYLTLLERLWNDHDPATAAAWNFGADYGDSRPVCWIADRVVESWGGASWVVAGSAEEPHEAGLLTLDSSRARELLGWKPRLRLEEAVQWVVDWHRRYADGQHPRQVTQKQIAEYQERLAP